MDLSAGETPRLKARRDLVEDSMDAVDYEGLYKDEDRERKIVAGIVAGQVYSKTSAPDSRSYWKYPYSFQSGGTYWGGDMHIRLPVRQALPWWAWLALFWGTAFYVTLAIVVIFLSA